MRTITLLSLLLLTAACATTPTNDFDVKVTQNDDHDHELPLERLHSVGLDITVANRTATPWTVEGVAVSTVSDEPYSIPRRAERWDERLGPGEVKTYHQHWPAAATVGFGERDIPLRVELYLIAPDGTRRTETFVR